MIKITKDGKEAKVRGYKKGRLLLQVGKKKFYLTQEQTKEIAKQIIKLLNKM